MHIVNVIPLAYTSFLYLKHFRHLAASSGSKFSAWDPINFEFLLALRFREILENEFSSASKSEWQDAEEDFHEPTSFTEDLNDQNSGFEQQEWSDIEEFGSCEEEEEEEDWRDAEEEEEYSDLSCCNFPDCRDSSDIPGSIARGSRLESYYKMVFKGMSEIRSAELGLSSSGIGVVIQSPDGDNLMQVQKKLDFYVDKTVAEHLALMDGVLAALELRVPRVQAFTDSDVVYDQSSLSIFGSASRNIPEGLHPIEQSSFFLDAMEVLKYGVLVWSLATALVPTVAGFTPGLIISRILVGIGEGVSPSAATDLIAREVLKYGVLVWSLATALVPTVAGFTPGLIISRILVGIGEGVSPSAATDLIARINEEMIETLFVYNTPTQVKSEATRQFVHPPLGQNQRILDPKKSQNIAILLRALNVTKEEVCDALMEGGTFALYSVICRHAKVSLIPNHQAEDKELSTHKLATPSRQLKRALKVKEALEQSCAAKIGLLLLTLTGTSMVIGDAILTPLRHAHMPLL